MLLSIFKQKGFSSPDLKELTDELKSKSIGYVIEEIPTDISTNTIVADAQYASILEILRSSTGGKSVIFTDGLSDELIGFMVGHMMIANTPYVIGEKANEVTKVLDMIDLPFIDPLEDEKPTIELIRKIVELNSCDFKKLRPSLNQLTYTGKISDFVLDGLMSFFGHKPRLYSTDDKFIKSLLKSKELC